MMNKSLFQEPDLESRALAEILADFSNNIMVRACAGSGKTRLLAAKCLVALLRQEGPGRVVAITFTEKAAQELKSRVLHFLKAVATALSPDSLSFDGSIPWAEIEHGLKAQRHFPKGERFWSHLNKKAGQLLDVSARQGLEIGTIHSFAKKILDNHPLEALGGLLTRFDASGAGLKELLGELSGDEIVHQAAALSGVSYAQLEALLLETLEETKKGLGGRPGETLSFSADHAFARTLQEAWPNMLAKVKRALEQSKEEGYLDYDLILYWLDRFLNEGPADMIADVQAGIGYILLDELQDTDPVQLRIIARLAGMAPGVKEAPGGRLFMVGDPFQSIYAFRGARPELIFGAKERMNVKEYTLAGNKRSGPGILRFVNEVFHGALEGYEPMGAAGKKSFNADVIYWHQMPAQSSGDNHDERRREARHVAAAIAGLARERVWPWKNFAILLRKMSNAWVYFDELKKAGVPAVLEGSETAALRMSLTVRDLFWLMTLYGNPDDSNARFYFQYTRRRDADIEQDIVRPVAGLRERLFETAAPGLIVTGLKQCFGLSAQARALGPEETRAWEIAEVLAWSSGGDSAAFLKTLRSRLEPRLEEEEEDRKEASWEGDAVRIATIHKAKGLQFPCVVVAGLADWKLKVQGKKLFWDPATGRAAIAFNSAAKDNFLGSDPALFKELKEARRQKELAEEARILYVALTRSEEMLVVFEPPAADRTRSRSVGAVLTPLTKAKTLAQEWDCPLCSAREQSAPEMPPAPPIAAGQSDPIEAVPAQIRPALLYASEKEQLSDQEHPAGKRAGKGDPRLIGQLIHSVLERLPWGPADQQELNRLFTQAASDLKKNEKNWAKGTEEEALAALGVFLQSDLWREISGRRLLARELPVAYAAGDSLIVGRVDLIYEEAPGLIVVADYKTEAASAQEHRLQGRHYLNALEGFKKRLGAKNMIFEVISISNAKRYRLGA
ncbi:MAG: UvrD-helicase domain-containing protein [Elusimicrobia bacterium]|nr:UvrD-helicase domain-containing protein [Elusimicrobiota bacterium]